MMESVSGLSTKSKLRKHTARGLQLDKYGWTGRRRAKQRSAEGRRRHADRVLPHTTRAAGKSFRVGLGGVMRLRTSCGERGPLTCLR